MIKSKLHFQRFEFKYYLPRNKADKLIPTLLAHMNWDPYINNSNQDFYQVNSLYFDSPDYGCFWDKESGISDRKKLRLRYYNQLTGAEHPVFLEIKRKVDALTVKDRINIPLGQTGRIDAAVHRLYVEQTDNQFIRELMWFKSRNVMRPKIFVSYKRKALVGRREGRFRVTFDYDIQSGFSNNLVHLPRRMKKIYPGGVVLELKYNNTLPFWFHRIIQKFQLQRLAYSKYSNSLRFLIPQFDDNNYLPI